jgi:hypothetical protein
MGPIPGDKAKIRGTKPMWGILARKHLIIRALIRGSQPPLLAIYTHIRNLESFHHLSSFKFKRESPA